MTKAVRNFVNDELRVPNCVPRWGLTTNHFLMGCQMKLWTIHVQMGVLEAIGSDVPNFLKDVPRVPKCVLRWGFADHFLMGSQMKLWTLCDKMGVLEATRWDLPNFTNDY